VHVDITLAPPDETIAIHRIEELHYPAMAHGVLTAAAWKPQKSGSTSQQLDGDGVSLFFGKGGRAKKRFTLLRSCIKTKGKFIERLGYAESKNNFWSYCFVI